MEGKRMKMEKRGRKIVKRGTELSEKRKMERDSEKFSLFEREEEEMLKGERTENGKNSPLIFSPSS